MARFILIDHASGYIYADTADLNGPARDESAIEAVRRFDESIGESRREYEEHGPDHVPATGLNVSAYHVYCDDITTSEVVPVVYDGQDQDTIDAVERECRKVAVIVCRDTRAD